MLCSRSRSWGVVGLVVGLGCGVPDTGGTSGPGTTSTEPEPGTTSPEVATSTDPGPLATATSGDEATSAGTGSAEGTTSGTSTEALTGGTGESTGTTSTSGATSTTGVMCQPADEACSGCVADRCGAGYCECADLGDCLCVLGCLDSDSLGALLGCVLGECGLVDASLDNLTGVVGAALSPLQECEALAGEGPDSCAGVCPALAFLP